MSDSVIISKCLETAFEAKYDLAKLSDAELAALISLQHSLWWQRAVLAYLLSDYSGRFEGLEKKCRPAINEALKRIDAERMPIFAEALLPLPRHFKSYSKRIEKLFGEYLDSVMTKESLSESEEQALVGTCGLLHNCRSKKHGWELKAQEIVDRWISSFDDHLGWTGITLADCISRVYLLDDYDVQRALKVKRQQTTKIYDHYLQDIDSYEEKEYCIAEALRSSDPENAETLDFEESLKKASSILLGSYDLEIRLLAAHSVLEILHALHLEEATAMASIPESTRERYLKAMEVENVTTLSDSELIKASQLAFSVVNTLRSLEDEGGFFIENLKIAETARQLCNELASRGGEKMLRLAKKIGFGDEKIDDVKEDWVIGGNELVGKLVEEALDVENTEDFSVVELVYLAQFLKVIHDNKNSLEYDNRKLEDAMRECFVPMWNRLCEGKGNPVLLFDGIKAIFDCQPAGLGYAFNEQMVHLEKMLVEALLKAKEPLRAIEVASCYPLRDIENAGSSRKYKDTIGMDLFREELPKWANEIEDKGYWPGLDLADAFRRIRIFQNDRLRSIPSIDYEWIISTAFNHYSQQVIELVENTRKEALTIDFAIEENGIELFSSVNSINKTVLDLENSSQANSLGLEDSIPGNYFDLIASSNSKAHPRIFCSSPSDLKLHPCTYEALGLLADCYFALPALSATDLMPAHLIRYCASGLESPLPTHSHSRFLFSSIILRSHLLQTRLLFLIHKLEYNYH